MGVHRMRMPQLGETVEEGTVVTWLVEPGAEVAQGDAVLEISTDKVDTEVESTVAGRLTRVLVGEGETVPVGAVLAELEVEGLVEEEVEAEPVATEPEAAAEPGSSVAQQTDVLLSPVVRRLIDEHGIDVEELVAAAGPKPSRKHVEAFLADRNQVGDVVPFSQIRKVTAQRMVASKATSPHVYTGIEVDFERVASVRAQAEPRMTWLPFVAHAVARTLGDFPRLNASVRDEGLVLHAGVHLGIAVDLDGDGLVVPVVREAGRSGLAGLAASIRDLAERARSKALTPGEVAGGTFTITGQGPHGTLFTAPIINQPQVAILSVDGIRKRAVVVGDDVVAHHTGVLTMSWDHRAVDGVYAAGFLAALRDRIEQTDWAGELG